MPGRFVAVLILLLVTACSGDGRNGLNPGDRAPNFDAIELSNAKTDLYSRSAKVYLINFWASWCAPCIQELPALQSLYTKLKSRGFEIIGVGMDDTVEALSELRDKYKVTYPVILDYQGEGKRRFQVKGVPESFVLDSKQQVVLITDPSSGQPITRLTGAREWDSPEMIALFEQLLAAQP